MKIISKYKDYYDYLVGIYGEDPLLVLDRRQYELPYFYSFDENKVIDLYIAGKRIQGLYKNSKFYWGEEIKQFAKNDDKYIRIFLNGHGDKYTIEIDNKTYLYVLKTPVDSDVNEKLGCPILMRKYFNSHGYDNNEINNFYKFPILKNLEIQSYLSPEKIWFMLTDYLSKKDDIMDNRTNNEKILNAGFDLKESFRGKPF